MKICTYKSWTATSSESVNFRIESNVYFDENKAGRATSRPLQLLSDLPGN